MATKVGAQAIPLLDLTRQYEPLRERVQAALARVVESQRFILGAEVEHFERRFAEYCGARHAIGCASGTDALELALMASGIGPGDEVLTVPFTFFATVGAILSVGARPVLIDVEPESFNLDIGQLDRVLAAHPAIKAILPVHLYGGCADMGPLLERTAALGIPVIEDAAQAVGAEYRGARAGSIGTIGCFSFFPTKNLGGFGDGGMVIAKEESIAKKLAALRVHGATRKYYHEYVGLNSRLDTLQAAVLRVKLKYLDAETAGRQRNADLYRGLLAPAGLPITLPYPAEYQTRHVYNQFVIRAPRRDELKAYLQENGIGSEIYYPLSLHQQPCFKDLGYREGDFPESEAAAREVLALPIHSALTNADIEYVCGKVASFYS